MPPTIYMGIDPGQSGGVAWIDGDHVWCESFKGMTERDTWEEFKESVYPTVCYLERVSAMPRQGVASTFKFGRHFGMLEAFLIAAEIPYELVTPPKWQRGMGCLSKGDKNVTKAKAQQLFPQLNITHAVADALLIAEYCRREWK